MLISYALKDEIFYSPRQPFICHALKKTPVYYYCARDALLYSARQMLISHVYPSFNEPYCSSLPRKMTPYPLYIYIYTYIYMLRDVNLFYNFLLQLALEGADSLPRGASVTQMKLKMHACSRGPSFILETPTRSRSCSFLRAVWIQSFICYLRGTYRPFTRRTWSRGLASLIETDAGVLLLSLGCPSSLRTWLPLFLEVLIPSSRSSTLKVLFSFSR